VSNFYAKSVFKAKNFQLRTKMKPSSIIKSKDGVPFSIKHFAELGLKPVLNQTDLKKKKKIEKRKRRAIPEEMLPNVSKMVNPLKDIFTPEMTEADRFEALGKLDFKMTAGLRLLLSSNPQLAPKMGTKLLENKVLLQQQKPGPTRAGMVHLVMDDIMRAEMADIAAFEKKEGNPPPKVSCGLGCSACCHRMIYVSKDEGQLYFNLLEELDGGAISDESMDRLENQSKYAPEDEIVFQNLPKEKSRCVFLDPVHQSCRIYKNRPLSCRRLQVTSDPIFCSPRTTRLDDSEIPVNLYLPLTETLATSSYNLDNDSPMQFKTLPQAILDHCDSVVMENMQKYKHVSAELDKDEKEFNSMPGSVSELRKMKAEAKEKRKNENA